MTDKVQKIRAEIEKQLNKWMLNSTVEGYYKCKLCHELLSFIDSLQEEPKFKTGNKVIYLNEEYEIADITDHYILHRIRTAIDGRISVLHLEFDKEELMELVEEPVSEDLDSFAIKYAQDKPYPVTVCQAVKVGAKWQFEQLMAKAVDGDITFDYYGDDDKTYGCIAHDSFCLEDFGLKDKDKVRMIFIKED